MKPFSRIQLGATTFILLFILAITSFNMSLALRRSRDAQRASDLGAVSDALHKFYQEYGYFPPAKDGKILMCRAGNFSEKMSEIQRLGRFDREIFFSGLRPCEWGRDAFSDLTGQTASAYLPTLPQDPKADEGFFYYYLSNSKRFQIFTYLEGGKDESLFTPAIEERGLACGKGICSFGKSFGETPLDRTIEEYEAELFARQQSGAN